MENSINNNNNYNKNNNAPEFIRYIIYSILVFFLCSRLLGIIILIFTFLGNNAYKSGFYNDYQTKFHTARIIACISVIITIILFMLGIVLSISSVLFKNSIAFKLFNI